MSTFSNIMCLNIIYCTYMNMIKIRNHFIEIIEIQHRSSLQHFMQEGQPEIRSPQVTLVIALLNLYDYVLGFLLV